MKLRHQTALVTGGSSGIGLALAVTLAELNNTVIICGRDSRKLQLAAQEHPRIFPIRCDLTNTQQREELVAQLYSDHPQLNILVNNAGVQYNYTNFDTSLDFSIIREELETNLTAPIFLTHQLLPLLQQHKFSSIVNVTSSLALVPKCNAASYSASKAALRSFTQSLRHLWRNSSVKVMEVMPGLVDTPMTAGRGKNKMLPEEVVNLIIRALEREQDAVYCKEAKIVSILNRLAPQWTFKLLSRMT